MSEKLSDYEIKILRYLNGDDMPDLAWGAAMGAAVEFLAGGGLVTRGPNYFITEKGKAFIASISPQETQ